MRDLKYVSRTVQHSVEKTHQMVHMYLPYPPASKASREEANFNKRKKHPPTIYFYFYCPPYSGISFCVRTLFTSSTPYMSRRREEMSAIISNPERRFEPGT